MQLFKLKLILIKNIIITKQTKVKNILIRFNKVDKEEVIKYVPTNPPFPLI